MKISGMESILQGSYQKASPACQKFTSKENLSYCREEYHLDLEFNNGSSLSVDFVFETMERKTEYEIQGLSGFTYDDKGYNETASRILDVARALWDGSSERLELLRDAISEGIKQARGVLGVSSGFIHELVNTTEAMINSGLDEMETEIQANTL